MSGLEHFNGYCVVTDPAGDQIVAEIAVMGHTQPTPRPFPERAR